MTIVYYYVFVLRGCRYVVVYYDYHWNETLVKDQVLCFGQSIDFFIIYIIYTYFLYLFISVTVDCDWIKRTQAISFKFLFKNNVFIIFIL